MIPKLDRRIARLSVNLASIVNTPDADTLEKVRTAALTQKWITELEVRWFGKE